MSTFHDDSALINT